MHLRSGNCLRLTPEAVEARTIRRAAACANFTPPTGGHQRSGLSEVNPRRKSEIQSALFPEGLVYDQKHLFLNHFNRLLVIDTESPIDPQYIIDDEESLIGVPDGI